jgi:hypothetical protein
MPVVLPTYDSSKVSNLSLSTLQIGVDLGGTWFETGGSNTNNLRTAGFSFDFDISNNTGGLVLAPRLPFTTATTDPAGTGETAGTWTFTIITSGGITDPSSVQTISLYGVVTPTPTTWSDSFLPSTQLTTLGSTYLIETITGSSSSWVFNGATYDLVFNFDFLTNYTETVGGATLTSPMAVTANSSNWTGVVQFIITGTESALVQFLSASYVGNIHSWHTGLANQPHDRRARVVHDYITGLSYLSDEAVPDGFRHGIMVHPDQWDPVDPLEDNPFTPPPGEGVVDDEIIDVE